METVQHRVPLAHFNYIKILTNEHLNAWRLNEGLGCADSECQIQSTKM